MHFAVQAGKQMHRRLKSGRVLSITLGYSTYRAKEAGETGVDK
jgi:hypothetical protein